LLRSGRSGPGPRDTGPSPAGICSRACSAASSSRRQLPAVGASASVPTAASPGEASSCACAAPIAEAASIQVESGWARAFSRAWRWAAPSSAKATPTGSGCSVVVMGCLFSVSWFLQGLAALARTPRLCAGCGRRDAAAPGYGRSSQSRPPLDRDGTAQVIGPTSSGPNPLRPPVAVRRRSSHQRPQPLIHAGRRTRARTRLGL